MTFPVTGGTKIFRTSNFIGPCYHEALLFSGLASTVAHKYHGKSFKSIPHNLKKYVNNYFSLVPEVLGN